MSASDEPGWEPGVTWVDDEDGDVVMQHVVRGPHPFGGLICQDEDQARVVCVALNVFTGRGPPKPDLVKKPAPDPTAAGLAEAIGPDAKADGSIVTILVGAQKISQSSEVLIASMTTIPVQDDLQDHGLVDTFSPSFDLTAKEIAPTPSPRPVTASPLAGVVPVAGDHREGPLPKIEWSEVERELMRQGLDPDEVVAQAASSLDAWSSLSDAERKSAYVFPSLDDE